MRQFARAILLCLVPELSLLSAAEHWIRLATPHFEMYTTNSAKDGATALAVFEQVRYFFLQSSPRKIAPGVPVQIIAFRSEKEYKPYAFNEGASAYYMQGRKADYIVMQDLSSEHSQTAMHEYTHLITNHEKWNLPLWLNEGLADVFSSLEPRGNQALVGRALPGRMGVLLNGNWLDLNTLFEVGHDSPHYNEKDKMSIFYSESWALAHMLFLSEAYRPGFPKFLQEVGSNHSTADAMQTIYGRSVSRVTKDLHAYVRQSSLTAAVYDIKLSKLEVEPEVSAAAPLAVDLTLADVLACREKTQAEASARLTQLAVDHADSPEVQESLGYLAWSKGNLAETKEHFKLAAEKGLKNPETLTQYARLLNEGGAPDDQIVAAFQKALEIKPDDQENWLDLAGIYSRVGKYSAALEAFSHLKSITAAHAYRLFSTQAYCYLHLNSLKQAREAAEKAKQYAKNVDETAHVSSLLSHLDSLERPAATPNPALADASAKVQRTELLSTPDEAPQIPYLARKRPRDQPSILWSQDLQHVEAVARSFDCDPKVHQLHVTVDGKEMVLEFDHPDSVIVRNAKDNYLDMQCGPQKPVKIGIFYVPSHLPGKVAGEIRELVF